jgi:hypothetical protein
MTSLILHPVPLIPSPKFAVLFIAWPARPPRASETKAEESASLEDVWMEDLVTEEGLVAELEPLLVVEETARSTLAH